MEEKKRIIIIKRQRGAGSVPVQKVQKEWCRDGAAVENELARECERSRELEEFKKGEGGSAVFSEERRREEGL